MLKNVFEFYLFHPLVESRGLKDVDMYFAPLLFMLDYWANSNWVSGMGRAGSSLSTDAQTSLSPDTSSSS